MQLRSMGSLKNEKKIVKGCIKGDRRSQQQLYEAFYGKMMAVCLRYAKDDDSAQDVCQEAFLKVFNKLDKFEDRGSLEGWIRRIMVTTSIDSIRKDKKNIADVEIEKVIEDESNNPLEEEDTSIFDGLSFDIIKEYMQKLTPAYRSVFNLYVVEEYSHKEIAEMLGISVGSSKSNLAKAKRNLRKEIEKDIYNIND